MTEIFLLVLVLSALDEVSPAKVVAVFYEGFEMCAKGDELAG